MSSGKLLMIGNYLPSPRHNRNIWHDLADRLESNGWEILTTSSEEPQLARLVDMMTTIIRKRGKFDIAQIDVFSGRAFIFADLCSLLLKLFSKPFVLTLHGGKLPEFAQRKPKKMEALLQRANYVVTPSEFMQVSLSQFRRDIQLIPNPVESRGTHYRVRRILVPHIIWVRAFHQVYNPSLAVQVLSLLIPDFPESKLTMIGPNKGDGSLLEVVELTRSLELQENVEIISGIDHTKVDEYLNQNDIFINSSNYDTAPRSVIEAMMNGLCVVSTNVGGLPWIIRDHEEGLLVPPNDPQQMVAAIQELLMNPELASKISSNAHQKALSYNWSSVLAQWEELFGKLMDQRNVEI